MHRHRLIHLTFVLAVAAGTAASPGCKRSDDAPKPGAGSPAVAVPVVMRSARTRPVQRWIDVVGTLWGEEDVTVSNKVNGKVIATFKDVGDRVEPGEPLAQLLRNDYQLALNQKSSALGEVLAQLGTEKVPPPDFDVSNLPAVRRARLQSENARSKFERGKQLHDRNPPLISDQDYADLQTANDVARSAYEAELLTGHALVTEARTRQAELAIADQALADTTIRAPRQSYPELTGDAASERPEQPASQPAATPAGAATGAAPGAPAGGKRSFVVSERYVSVGELLPAVSKMFRVVDDDPLKFRAAVPERYVGDIKVGQKVGVRVDAYPDAFPGEVSRINPQIDPVNRTFHFEILVPNADGRLRPGGFARGRVMTQTQPDVVFVPQEAVVTFAGVNKVFTVSDGKAAEVPVELGERDGDEVEVLKGLKGNESVVVSGTSKLATGVPVSIQPPAGAPAGAPAPAAGSAAALASPEGGRKGGL